MALDPATVRAVFKAYDVRGLVGTEIDEELARAVGAAFVRQLGGREGAKEIVVGYDMRPSSPALAGAFADGATRAGADVVMIGLASTDQLYFASGHFHAPGAMFTASHNPAQYNGIKLCRAGARPVGSDSGLAELRDAVLGTVEEPVHDSQITGQITEHDVLEAYAAHLVSLAPVAGRPLSVVVDAGNGMAGHTAPAVFGRLGAAVELHPLYFELDGTFPHHDANPIDPGTLVDLQDAVVTSGADVGLAFDGDADRCFLVDERGAIVSPSALTALIAERELARHPGSTIIHNLITSRAVPELVGSLGGTAVRTRVGHSFIKATMEETGAVFGGEHSGHFYFRDFWRADSGMLAALHALAALAESGCPLSELVAGYDRYPLSGEINSTTTDPDAALAAVRSSFGSREGARIDELDGLTVSHPDWQLNLRRSNTEPLLRLNVEGADHPTMTAVRDEALALIHEGSP
ncbi:phosphomannomutase/phosphoglucomutase [Nocardioides sp. GXZ039]|uniref:phosphomannomutase/phosphoglucomutase n=1 Tax=Nocardioides sp. GXZ039 TaxID=3136018 RepID=UPI0030F38324